MYSTGVVDADSLFPPQIVWAIGRKFGFQAFNQADSRISKTPSPPERSNSTKQYAPATLFLAADHLQELLSNQILRTKLTTSPTSNTADETPASPPQTTHNAHDNVGQIDDNHKLRYHQRYCRAVWELHSQVFFSYTQWLRAAQLPFPRSMKASNVLEVASWTSSAAIQVLLMELSTYFLLWSEAANLRHCPEAMWFFYHCMVMSPEADELVSTLAQIQPTRGQETMYRRLMLRNLLHLIHSHRSSYQIFQEDIQYLQCKFQHNPSSCSLAQCAEVYSFVRGKVNYPSSDVVGNTPAIFFEDGDVKLLEDLVSFGDGGLFMDRVITPVFMVISYEVDYLAQKGEEVAYRLGYDDINESLTHPDIVRRTLLSLGTSKSHIKKGASHDAFHGIMQLGVTCTDDCRLQQSLVDQEEGLLGSFDALKAAVFWSSQVFVKTYYERRSWLALYRAFHRVYTLQAVLLHVLLAAAFTEGQWSDRTSWTIISSAVITHAFCAFVERWSNMWMCRRQRRPLQPIEKEDAWITAKTHHSKQEVVIDVTLVTQLAAARKKRLHITVEGAPFLGCSGPLEYFLVLAGLLGMFVLQYLPQAGSLNSIADQYWLYAAGGYTAMVIGHGVFTTRNGYQFTFHNFVRTWNIPFFSSRLNQCCWIPGDMSIGWGDWSLTVVFWVIALSCKIAFDYYVLWKGLAGPVRVLLANRQAWLPCTQPLLIPFLPIVPCVDGIWVIIIIRLLPCILISMTDLSFIYQVVLLGFGIVQALSVLDLGLVGDFPSLARQFHRAPVLWWHKVMSGPSREVATAQAMDWSSSCTQDPEASLQLHLTAAGVLGSREGATGHSPLPEAQYRQPPWLSASGMNHVASSVAVSVVPGQQASSVLPGFKKGGGALDLNRMLKLKDVVSGRSVEHVAMWDSFACAWDEIVEDLRESDLISNKERDNLRFIRLAGKVKGGVRPVLLPSFWTAGQLEKVVDTGLVDSHQALVLSELSCLLVYLGCELGVLSNSFSEAILAAQFCTQAQDIDRSKNWEAMLCCTSNLMSVLLEIAFCRTVMPEDLRRRQVLHGNALMHLQNLLQCLEAECAAARMHANILNSINNTAPTAASAAVDALLSEIKQLYVQLAGNPSTLSSCLRAIHDENVFGHSGGSCSDASSSSAHKAFQLVQIIQVIHSTLTITPSEAQPSGSEAQRILTFFMSSLSNPHLKQPTPLHEMPSWTILTPFYEEEVLYALDSKSLALKMGCSVSSSKGCADLTRESEDGISLLSYLRSVYPKDWECFKERLSDQLGGELDLSAVNEADFNTGGALQELGLQLQLWASFRGQLLARTVRGMMCYQRALRILARLEYPFVWMGHTSSESVDIRSATMLGCNTMSQSSIIHEGLHHQPGQSESNETELVQRMMHHERCINMLVARKFSHVVSAQVYGHNRDSKDVRKRWMVEGINTLMCMYGHLKVAYLDTVVTEHGSTQFSVLVKGSKRIRGGSHTSPTASPSALYAPHSSAPLKLKNTMLEMEDHGRVGAFGDEGCNNEDCLGSCAEEGSEGGSRPAGRCIIQELYRVRLPINRFSSRGVILGEGKPENQNHAIIFCHGEALQTIDMNQDNNLAEALKMRNLLSELKPETTRGSSQVDLEAKLGCGQILKGAQMMNSLLKVRKEERPTALVGFREWIFSEKAGALGSFSASAEFAFSTIIQRTMAAPAHVRLHYGHPDVFNKLYCMTRGGVSKATRQLHVSEDVFCGINLLLRGARIKYREYISVGKGRDMTFDSINAFEIKTSSGNGNVVISRDLWRLASGMDLFRLLHLYHSGCGHYVNSWLMMITVYVSIFSLAFISLTRMSSIITKTYDSLHHSVVVDFSWQNTDEVEYVFQLGALSILPFLAESIIEYGPARTAMTMLHQTFAGSLAFFISRQQTSRTAFQEDLQYGGAQYIATGRGFALSSVPFIKVYMNYGRTHILPGFELGFLCLVVYTLHDCFSCNYSSMTWGIWLVSASLIFSPFWFNPLTFSITKVRSDLKALAGWLSGEIDPDTNTSWYSWHAQQLEKVRNDQCNQTGHAWTKASSLIFNCTPPLLLAFAAFTGIDVQEVKIQGPSWATNGYAVYVLSSLSTWATAILALLLSRWYQQQAIQQYSWRLCSMLISVICAAILTSYLVVTALMYTGNPFTCLMLVVFSNFNILLAIHRAAYHLASHTTPTIRALVDKGCLWVDAAAAYCVLAVVGAASLLGVVAWAQHKLLFSVSFAACIRRGQLLGALRGKQKAQNSN
ncbi:hypothetical protein CEUSTIGMA_g7147.t1 [Chlamydomonas eustigma]|uniref:1,3-beta-glucan synthase n=1 Tax=Chlamydomonas eustigma TaxID=1157962 RepID=A0A250X9F9_9CHLO|nr:hypothetical protein CEUSTIGMA_g7147.t1 [Chlamydomonas eustigma]|eukprot:GAX79706.1 hypothetical protein CEUSTIGMA_g7147.t1 [Chlamydomonas eustigma]